MFTQCPECQTIYQIGEDVLHASFGIVRCGNCSTRFDALRTLSDTLPEESPAALVALDPGERVPTLSNPVPAPRGDESAQPGTRAPEAPSVDGPDDWFADFESELVRPPDRGYTSLFASDRDPPRPPAPAGFATRDDDTDAVPDPAGTQSLLPPAANDASESDSVAAMPQPDPGPAEDPPVEDVAPRVAGEDEPQADAVVMDGDGDGNADPAAPTATGEDAEPVDDAIEAPGYVYIPPRRRRVARATLAWATGCLLLALALAAQLAWAHRVDLFRDPATRPWMARVCDHLPCRLGPIKDVAQLELVSRDIRPDPDAAGALTITATVRNRAGFRQPWPVVVVELADLDDHPVAMRRFRPAEYMPDPARRAGGIAPGATAVVAFEVADPGKSAVSFRFAFE